MALSRSGLGSCIMGWGMRSRWLLPGPVHSNQSPGSRPFPSAFSFPSDSPGSRAVQDGGSGRAGAVEEEVGRVVSGDVPLGGARSSRCLLPGPLPPPSPA